MYTKMASTITIKWRRAATTKMAVLKSYVEQQISGILRDEGSSWNPKEAQQQQEMQFDDQTY